MDKKPKCYLCGETGDSPEYYWVAQRGGGKMAHVKCYVRITEKIQANSESALLKMKKELEAHGIK